MKRIFKIVFFTGLAGIALFITMLAFTSEQPPLQEIRNARETITKAKRNDAHLYSPVRYFQAMNKYDSAMYCWNNENQRFILFRNYDNVEKLAIEAQEIARNAIYNATTNSFRIKKDLKQKLDSLTIGIGNFQKYFDRLPLSNDIRKQIQQGMLMYGEAKIAFDKHDLTTAGEKIEYAENLIKKSYHSAQSLMHDYFQKYSDWKKWTSKAIESSRKSKSCCIVIDKFSHECLLYHNGKLKRKFAIELGNNWMANKIRQGDKSTPEGNYRVVDQLTRGQTRFYKAMLIDYPNEDDKRRFDMNKKNGTLTPDAAIGSLIEIHGHGGKGADWTNGCIALSDSDMDILFSSCPVGTRVTIVGSVKSLNELLIK